MKKSKKNSKPVVAKRKSNTKSVLSSTDLRELDAYWRAANYLSVGQIYLYDNPLLKKPLSKEHVKPRLLGHWGTTPGLNFVYVHLNRLIKAHDLKMIYITGPGHGGPGLVASRPATALRPGDAIPAARPKRAFYTIGGCAVSVRAGRMRPRPSAGPDGRRRVP